MYQGLTPIPLAIAAQPVPQQGPTIDCGLSAIALTTDPAFSIDPSARQCDVTAMRKLLEACFQSRIITPFSQFKCEHLVDVNSSLTLELGHHCLCLTTMQCGIMEACDISVVLGFNYSASR